ncbi:MAG: WYL domain-containing protein [Chloroflexi bacterium]|nr:WYL domain-containing protein [Chloroflexota bacterium]
MNRAERLAFIERMLFRNSSTGLRAVEIARACGVDRRTIYRDLALLDKMGVPLLQEDGRFCINREYYSANIRLNLNEAVALFIAARMLSRHAEQQNPHVISALSKLAASLPEPLATHVNYIADSVRAHPVDRNFVLVLETITRGWLERRRVKLWGSLVKSGEISVHEFSPYFVEPTANGGLYAIGFDDLSQSVRAFKVVAIRRALLLDSAYEIPRQFDRRHYLANMWGITGGSDARTQVVLAFSPDVTPLIKERIWHSSQRIETLDDKRCTLTVQVNDWHDLLPWIRSWGAQVEVLEPLALRRELADEAARVAAVYNTAAGVR